MLLVVSVFALFDLEVEVIVQCSYLFWKVVAEATPVSAHQVDYYIRFGVDGDVDRIAGDAVLPPLPPPY